MPTLDLSELNIIITVLGTTLSFQQRRFTANRYQVPLLFCTVLDQSRSSKYGTLARLSQRCLQASYWVRSLPRSLIVNDGGMLLMTRLRRSRWYACCALPTSTLLTLCRVSPVL